MLSYARHGDWPSVRGTQGASTYFGIGHQNVFCRTTIRLESNLVWGIKATSHFVLHFWIRSSKASRDNIDPHIVGNTAIYTEIIMGASGACLDVKLGSAWRLAPGKRSPGASPLFWLWTQKRPLLPNYLSESNQIMRHQGIETF